MANIIATLCYRGKLLLVENCPYGTGNGGILAIRPLRLTTLLKVCATAFICLMSKYITDEFGNAKLVHEVFSAVLEAGESAKKWYRKEVSRLKRVRQRQLGRKFPYRPAYRKEKKAVVEAAVVPQAPPPKVLSLPRQTPNAPSQAPGGRSRRPRAARKKNRRYRHGWNRNFSIMPLEAKRRPYYYWPRS